MIDIRADRSKCECFHVGPIAASLIAGLFGKMARLPDETVLVCDHGSHCKISRVEYAISDYKLFLTER